MIGGVGTPMIVSYRSVPLVLFLLVVVTACSYTLEKKRQMFRDYYIKDALGLTIAEVTRYRLGHKKPSKIKNLQNGNDLYVYRLFEYRYGDNNTCTLLLEVAPDTKTVVSGDAKGKGCYVVP